VVAEQFQNLYNGSMLESSENVTITELDAGFFNNQTQKRGGCNKTCNTIVIDCAGNGTHHSGNVLEWGSCIYIGTSNGP